MTLLNVTDIFNPWQRMLITIVISFLSIAGFFGNLIVCITFSKSKSLKTSAYTLILNLAVTDTLQCLNMIFMVTAASDVKWFRINGLCQLNAFGQVTFIGTSILSLSLISVNRYFTVVKHSNRDIFTRRNTFISIFFVWFIPIVLAISPVLGWSKHAFRAGYMSCLLEFGASLSYLVVFFIIFLIIPSVVMCFCCWKIIITLKKNNQRIQEVTSASRHSKDEKRITIMLFVVIISFLIFYMPISIVNFIEALSSGEHKIDPSVEIVTLIMSQLNHVNNPIIYGFLNRNCRRAFMDVFCCRQIPRTYAMASRVLILSPVIPNQPNTANSKQNSSD